MKKTLTAIALLTALAAGTSGANARGGYDFEANPMHIGHNEGLQNFYYYFGSNCCGSTIADRGGRPCGPIAAPAPTCNTCPPINACVEMEQRCSPCPAPCDPCGGSGWLPWNW